MRRVVVACLLYASGCSQPVLIHPFDGSSLVALTELPDVVDEACMVVGLECEFSAHSYGAVTIDIVNVEERSHGRTFDGPCSPVVRADEDPLVIAHELGHVFELVDRHNAQWNVMNQDVQGDMLTDEQQDVVWYYADLFVNCR